MVSLLLRLRSDVDLTATENRDNYPVLHHAVAEGKTKTVSVVLVHRPNLDTNMKAPGSEETALHVAAKSNRVESVDIAKLLLGRDGVDVNARDRRGNTPLHACMRAHIIATRRSGSQQIDF